MKMNNIYRIVRTEANGSTTVGHFTSKLVASIVLSQLRHRRNQKLKYMKDHKISFKYDSSIENREYRLESISFDDINFQDVIKTEPSIGQLKKAIYAR